ncbi:hypothetical protein KAH37_00215, partial [bacterium]|nr:hypothetical protein [bacterium]
MKFKQLFVLVALVASLLLVACTTERDPIDKSPELALDKSLFEGEFFYRQTIVDLPYTADYSFIGESNDGKILKWKITKNWLIAYNVHDGLEVVNTSEDPTVNETPLLAYRIFRHFDILPMENPVTGEDLPVYTANYDCDWNECRFVEIDHTYAGTPNFELKYMALSEQLWGAPYVRGAVTSATDFEFYAHDGSFIPPKFYSYMLKKAGDDKEDKKVEGFTFKTQEQLLPINWGQFYTWADIEEFFKNEPANIWYRHTFTKVNREVYGRRTYDAKTKTWPWKKGSIDNGFRPMQFNDEQFRMFGYFVNKFRGYNPDHGNKWADVYILANYFNIGWGRLKGDAKFEDGITAGENIEWNFTCEKASGDSVAAYNECIKDIAVQQKLVFTSSAETPKRMIAPNCAMAKDYNHAFLASRYAAMNPGSDTRDFEKWYNSAYVNDDFFTEYKVGSETVLIRDYGWYTHTEDYDGWEEKCFIVPTADAHVQKWNGDIIEDKYTNEIGVFVRNPVEGFIAARDGNHLSRYENYDGFAATTDDVEDDANAVRICVPKADADGADEYVALMYFENCLTNDTQMTKLYTEEYGRDKWKGDRWDCRVLDKGETCEDISEEAAGSQKDVEEWVEVKAACVVDNERNCKTYGTDTVRPMLRHKFMNGDTTVAMWNWVDQPTEYGILGVSQWNMNPETGQTFGAGSNVAGAVLAWAVDRGVQMSRMLVSSDGDPAAWDWEDLIHPEFEDMPSNIWDNSPQDARDHTSSTMSTRSLAMDDSGSLIQGDPSYEEKLDLIQMPQYQNRFDFASVKGTKWESKMLPHSMLKAMFPWSDPTAYNYSDDMKEQLSHIFIPEQTEIEMQRLIQRGQNTYFEASFLDGAIIQFLQERQAIYRVQYPKWKTTEKDAYTKAFLGAVADDLEILLYKGVAEHEMGHSLGLRHNFISSADMFNYQDGYFTTENYPNLMKEEEKLVKELTENNVDPGAIGDAVYALKRSYPYAPERNSKGEYVLLDGADKDVTPMSYNMYVSIMDYQSEPYIHAVGLGKYDYAAIKFVYGRSVEQMDFDSQGFVKMSTDNPVRDARYPQPVLKNLSYIREDGKLKTLADYKDPRVSGDKNTMQPSKLERYYEGGELKWRVVVDVLQDDSSGSPLTDKETGEYVTAYPDRYIINDGSIYPYLFFSDETRMDEPASNVWDTGYLATDIIRSFR